MESCKLIAKFALPLLMINLYCAVGSRGDTKFDRKWMSLSCSLNEMVSLQSRWKWLMTKTTVADKTALFNGVIDYIAERNATKADYLTQKHSSGKEPTELMAYRLFTDIDLYINAYTSLDTYISMIEHLALTRTVWTRKIVENIDLLFEAIVQVIGRLIVSAEENTIWSACMEHMAQVTKIIASSVRLEATCDVVITSGDPAFPIKGTVNFSQPAIGGPTSVIVDLTGFTDNQIGTLHGIHIHEGGSIDDRCMKAAAHFSPFGKEHGGPQDINRHLGDLGNLEVGPDGRVYYKLVDKLVSLAGEHNVIGRTVVIHVQEDDLGRGGYPDSKTTGHAGGRIACCVIHRVYE